MISQPVLAPLRVLAAHDFPVQSIAFGPTSALMATADTERIARVWQDGDLVLELDLQTKQEKIRPTERVRGLSFSPAGSVLFTACGDLVRAFEVGSGAQLWEYRPPRSFGFLIISPITLSVSPEGQLAMATDSGRIGVFDPSGQMTRDWWDNDSPRQVAFVGERLIGTDSFSVCVWDNAGRKLAKRRLKERAYGMAASPDGSRLCVRTIRGVEELDPRTLDTIATYPTDLGMPLVAWSADGECLAVSDVTSVIVYSDGQAVGKFDAGSPVKSLRFTPEGMELAAGCFDGVVRFWKV